MSIRNEFIRDLKRAESTLAKAKALEIKALDAWLLAGDRLEEAATSIRSLRHKFEELHPPRAARITRHRRDRGAKKR